MDQVQATAKAYLIYHTLDYFASYTLYFISGQIHFTQLEYNKHNILTLFELGHWTVVEIGERSDSDPKRRWCDVMYVQCGGSHGEELYQCAGDRSREPAGPSVYRCCTRGSAAAP